MCGIVGKVLRPDVQVSFGEIEAMTKRQTHRGPDGCGVSVFQNVGLGHRRLSIIDLSDAASQPMISADDRYVLSYNGELYNFQEIRQRLAKFGFVFKSNSDTEVVLAAYQHYGVECFKMFNGMFACAILDKKNSELVLARDPFGIKPLYLGFFEDCFLFSSEIKSFYAVDNFVAETNKKAFLQYLTFQNFFDHQTLFSNVCMFPPGHYLKLDTNKLPKNESGLNLTQYWDFNFEEPEIPKSEEEYSEEIRWIFESAVKRQLVSDVDVNSYLSGGMDSGSIVAVASQLLPELRTFTCGFDLTSASGLEMAFDERMAAERLSYEFKTEHYEMVLKAGDMERVMQKYVLALENPMVGQSYMNFCIANLASKFGKVVLAGTGGDELFGGYHWRYFAAGENENFEEYLNKYCRYWQRLVPTQHRKEVFAPIQNSADEDDIFHTFLSVFPKGFTKPTSQAEFVNLNLYFESKTFLHGLLTVEDKLSMAHSLETRVPFLDKEFVEVATKVPAHLKVKQPNFFVSEGNRREVSSFKRSSEGKYILRKALKDLLPPETTSFDKQGFSAPDASWAKGESIDYVRAVLGSKNSKIYSYVEYSAVKRILDEHFSGHHNHRLFIWSMIFLEQWFAEFMTAK